MSAYAAKDFNLASNQKAERKLLVTCVNLGDPITQADGTPKWVPVGVGVEDSSIEYNPTTTKKTDIFGFTETSVDKLEPSQSLTPMTIRGGNPFLFKLVNIVERGALSELSLFDVMIIRAYLKEGEADAAGGYHAEVHRNCTITPQSEGGGATVDTPVTIDYSNDKILGTVNGYKLTDTINFAPNTAA